MKNLTVLAGSSQTQPKSRHEDILTIRQQVISGNWTAINNGDFTLTDLGLRHNGSGLVWLRSGVSVQEAENDTGFTGVDKVSFEYHEGLRAFSPLCKKDNFLFVHAQHIDNYCHSIIFNSLAYHEFTHRWNGKPLATFAIQIDQQERKKATDNWRIYRNPKQPDKYALVHYERHAGIIREYERQGWKCELIGYLASVVRDNAEFSRLMVRLGYVQVRTRKITGRWETFWLYRSSRRELLDDTPLRAVKPAPRNGSRVTVQASEKPQKAFKLVAVDGRWLYIYDDHIRYLRKIRTRIDGKQVQGYTAKGVRMEVLS